MDHTRDVIFSESSLGDQFKSIIESSDNGIHNSFMERHGYPTDIPHSGTIVEFEKEHHMSSTISNRLTSFSKTVGGITGLYPFQVNSIKNMVFRPKKIKTTKTIKKYRVNCEGVPYPRLYMDSGVVELSSESDDIGMTVINDLFTGSGKTLTSVLAALIFATDRRDEVISRFPMIVREQYAGSWNTRMCMNKVHGRGSPVNPMCTPIPYSNSVVIMCDKHLTSQWISACRNATSILGINVDIVTNPKKDSAFFRKTGLNIIIFNSLLLMIASPLKFVPVVIVDEFVVRHRSNILIRTVDEMPLHGRLILVSADAGSVKKIIIGSNKKGFLRSMTGFDNSDIGFDVEDTMKYSIPLISASVLPTKEREQAKVFMVSKLSGTPFEEYIVKYTPSLSSRLFGVNSEMSALSGKQIFMDKFGINMDNIVSIGDIMMVVTETISNMDDTDNRLRHLETLYDTLQGFVKDEGSCPICLESYDKVSDASLINPCWHIFCDDCVTKLLGYTNAKCPMCRCNIEGHTSASNTIVTSEKREDVKRRGIDKIIPTQSLLENMNGTVDSQMGLDSSCLAILKCIENDARVNYTDECYRVIMVVPDDHFFERFYTSVREEFDEDSIEMIRFQTIGNKRKRVTSSSLEKQIQVFNGSGGARVKILFTSEGKTDSLTGLDFPNVDCVFSVGYGNTLQRIGRLTRIPKFLDEKYIGKVVRSICLVPSSMIP